MVDERQRTATKALVTTREPTLSAPVKGPSAGQLAAHPSKGAGRREKTAKEEPQRRYATRGTWARSTY